MLAGSLLKDRYRLVRRLGGGAEGETFAAWDQVLQRKVAIKFQLARVVDTTTDYSSFGRYLTAECDLLQNLLDIPGIPKVFDSGSFGRNDRKFIVMELVKGVTLDSWIRDHHPVPISAAAAVVGQLCVILGDLHAKGYVHRDVTPKNTMLQPDGRVRLLDVGIAIESGVIENDPRGTPGYGAPEQLINHSLVTPQADIFGLGALLFKMVGLRLPYSGLEYPFEATAQPFPDGALEHVPEPLRALGLAMVAIRPDGRPDGVAEVLRQLRPVLPQPGSPASPKATRPDPTSPWRSEVLMW
ncbi:serine/threonine-protein kinase [Streptomyces murinus]|uniref:serine/threonine-protein kinase n=1 Tax=Streptomyces murinus TaxID=33900 RepID=UPI0021147911|nr:serine/threonine-protein kinase [Streptomyces murinus]